jgi:peroxiredoxin
MASNKQKTMLDVGELAPDFDLDALSGGRRTLSALSAGKPLLLAFYKVSCPTCQYTFPFLERLYRGRSNQEIAMYAISQDDPASTREFDSEFGITLPTLLDKEEEGYPASNAYGLSHVPAIFLVEPDRKISLALVGFDKKGLEALGRRLGKEPFEPDEYVPEWKSG